MKKLIYLLLLIPSLVQAQVTIMDPAVVKEEALGRLVFATQQFPAATFRYGQMIAAIDEDEFPRAHLEIVNGLSALGFAWAQIDVALGILGGAACGPDPNTTSIRCEYGGHDISVFPGHAAFHVLAYPVGDDGTIGNPSNRATWRLKQCTTYAAISLKFGEGAIVVDQAMAEHIAAIGTRCGTAWVAVDDALYYLAWMVAEEHKEHGP